jgi:hypothetical protein
MSQGVPMNRFYIILVLIPFMFSGAVNKPEPLCISAEEFKLFQLINNERSKRKLSQIPLSAKLTVVATTHARNLEAYHKRGGACNLHSWYGKGKWRSCCYKSNHSDPGCMWEKPREITGYDDKGYEVAFYHSGGANASEALDSWLKSRQGHANVILNRGIWKNTRFNAMGVGIYGKYAVVWFGENQDNSRIVKVCGTGSKAESKSD